MSVVRGRHLLLDITEAEDVKEFLRCLDFLAKDIMRERCLDWFRKTLSTEEIDATYSPRHIVDSLGRHSVAMQLSPKCAVWSSPGRLAQLHDLREGVEVVPSVSIAGLYFERRSFGLCLRVAELLLFSDRVRDSARHKEKEKASGT